MILDNDIEKVLISEEQIQKKCTELGQQITKEYQDKNPLFVGLLKGCVPFLAELIKHVYCDMEFDFMDVSSYFGGTESTGKILIEKDLSVPVENRHVLIIDDIIDSGLTLKEITTILLQRKAKSVECCTLLDKPEGRTTKIITPKYVGYTIERQFVVGFGLDYNQKYRNLPYIGILKESVYKD